VLGSFRSSRASGNAKTARLSSPTSANRGRQSNRDGRCVMLSTPPERVQNRRAPEDSAPKDRAFDRPKQAQWAYDRIHFVLRKLRSNGALREGLRPTPGPNPIKVWVSSPPLLSIRRSTAALVKPIFGR